MKLLSTTIDAQTVELVFANTDQPNDAAQLITIRMSVHGNEQDTLAHYQYWAIRQTIEELEHMAVVGRRVEPNTQEPR